MKSIIMACLLTCLCRNVATRCSFQVGPDGIPQKVDKQPFLVSGMQECVEYNGQLGCCDSGNEAQQARSYGEIDGIFGSMGDGCDICAINLKRFWCEYACSPNQSEFLDVKDGLWPIPNPQKPDQTLMVQKLDVTVHADTACTLFNSCKRISFVSSVSAMSTPAGFLTFQGHNAANDALQDMDIKFSFNKSQSIYFGDEREEESSKALQQCNATTTSDTLHGFSFFKNCSCNNCESACKNDQGFIYHQTNVMEGFNYILVGSVYFFCIVVSVLVAQRRSRKETGRKEILIGVKPKGNCM